MSLDSDGAIRPGHDPKLLAINHNTYENSNHNSSYNVTNNYIVSKEDKLQRAFVGQSSLLHVALPIQVAHAADEYVNLELKPRISKGAAHDSAERGPHAPKCDKGTREAVQDDILSWIDRGIEALLWLTGRLGQESQPSLARLQTNFAGQPDRYSKEYLFPTLAYHLIHLNIPGLREEILSAIDACPSVFDKSLDRQLRILILDPLGKVDRVVVQSSTFKTIIIDGVDECKESWRATADATQDRRMSKEDNHCEIISTLVRASNDPSFPFRIIIASRPERAIERCFTSLPSGAFKRIFLGDDYNPTADIELYLRAKFDTIGRNHGLQDQWYLKASKKNVPRYLAEESSGQFIYAATIIRYIQDAKDTPHEQLKHVLNWQGVKSSRPFAALDALYTGILKGSVDPPLSVKWIRLFGLDWPPFQKEPSWYQKAILESSPGQTEVVLGKLTALVGLSDDEGEPEFTFYHKSLTDFLMDKDRSEDLHFERKAVEQFLEERYYQVLKNRGPQGWLPPDLQKFNREFCDAMHIMVDCHQQYDARDVDWWISQLHNLDGVFELITVRMAEATFHNVHVGVSNIFKRPVSSLIPDSATLSSVTGTIASQLVEFGGKEFYAT
ncbi:hypothetical protein NMY22_g19384 [Coprinellus aureogranulatus]|nr:hypothetical protein NMY22_g19384 [Coprinellus aureogranulatus]